MFKNNFIILYTLYSPGPQMFAKLSHERGSSPRTPLLRTGELLWLMALICAHPGLPSSILGTYSGTNLTFHQCVLVSGGRSRQHPELRPDLVQLFLLYLPTPDHTWVSQAQNSHLGKSYFFTHAELLGELVLHGPRGSVILASSGGEAANSGSRADSWMVTIQALLVFFFLPIPYLGANSVFLRPLIEVGQG